jgi:Glyoxalase/Bleomycin resistance protein/Dioxygenase superfamily
MQALRALPKAVTDELATSRVTEKPMHPSPVTDLKTFLPTKDSELSKKFYTDLGFTINWSNEQIAELQIGSFRFLLQTFYVDQPAKHFMMSLNVEDADAWWEHIQRHEFAKKYPGIMCKPPRCSRGEFEFST